MRGAAGRARQRLSLDLHVSVPYETALALLVLIHCGTKREARGRVVDRTGRVSRAGGAWRALGAEAIEGGAKSSLLGAAVNIGVFGQIFVQFGIF
ncbi:hypothetical protein AA23498_1027 [Acetobacter nitrogenifigens DSM 23921 = NBRC 105050]|nr:hypothetical protein AA23498_1027 [Acetobacter nitrogenifigens DSM 23921 = NBRC 105050]